MLPHRQRCLRLPSLPSDLRHTKSVITFSGVGAHHQNGIAERGIKTISQWARSNLLHATSHWSTATIKLWPQALDYAVWVYNRMPAINTGISPLELWTQTRNTSNELRRAHVFGCPIYVLDPALQDGNKIPKWTPRSRLGLFVGFSPHHSSLVPLVLNTTTGKISPQFHVVFDDDFNTVPSPGATLPPPQWQTILSLFTRECYLDATLDTNGNKTIDPPEQFDWNSVLSTPTHTYGPSTTPTSTTPTAPVPPDTHTTTPPQPPSTPTTQHNTHQPTHTPTTTSPTVHDPLNIGPAPDNVAPITHDTAAPEGETDNIRPPIPKTAALDPGAMH